MDELLDKLQSGKDYSLIYLRNAARGVNVNYLGAVTPDYEGGKIYALFNGYPYGQRLADMGMPDKRCVYAEKGGKGE